jgi:hypothetical protein
MARLSWNLEYAKSSREKLDIKNLLSQFEDLMKRQKRKEDKKK